MKKTIFSIFVTFLSILILFVNVYADTTSIFFASDYQFHEEYTPDMYTDASITSCQPVLKDLVGQAKADGKNIETVVIGGDYTQNDGNRDMNDFIDTDIFGTSLEYYYGNNPAFSFTQIKSAVEAYYPKARNIYVQGNHDPDTDTSSGYLLDKTGPIEFDEYTIYVLNDQDFMGEIPRVNNPNPENLVPGSIKTILNPTEKVMQTAANLEAYLKNRLETNDLRPVFICSHQPIHDNENNRNRYSYYIVNAINTYAEKLDIIFFFGHTHLGIDDLGGGVTFVKKGTTLRIPKELNSVSVTLNFTYMNYGFLGYYSGTNEFLSATVVDITDTEFNVTKYIIGNGTEKYKVDRINPPAGKVIGKNVITIKIGSNILDKNGNQTTLDVPAQTINDRTMLPMRAIFEALGANVTWDNLTQTAKASKGDIKVSIQIGSSIIYKNDVKKRIDVPAQLVNDRTLVPVRAIAECFEADVQWDEATETVTITMIG